MIFFNNFRYELNYFILLILTDYWVVYDTGQTKGQWCEVRHRKP